MAEPTPVPPIPASTPSYFSTAPVMADPFVMARRELLDSLSDEFLHNYAKGRTLLAVDGADTAAFADALATRLGRGAHAVFRASIDAFHRPQEARAARGGDSDADYFAHAFDYDLFRRVLVEPFRMGGSTGFVLAAFDAERDIPVEMQWETGPRDATLIVDGTFLNRPELRGLWNFSIWLESRQQDARHAAHPGAHALYAAQSSPRSRATAIVDNANPEHPRRVFADSC